MSGLLPIATSESVVLMQPTSVLMSMACGTIEGYADVHPWFMLLPRAMIGSMIHAMGENYTAIRDHAAVCVMY